MKLTGTDAKEIRDALRHRTITIEDFEQAVRDARRKVETADYFLAEALFKHFSEGTINLAVAMRRTGALSDHLVELANLIAGEPGTLMLSCPRKEMRITLERTEDGLDISVGVISGSREDIWRYAGTAAEMLGSFLGTHVPVITFEEFAEE